MNNNETILENQIQKIEKEIEKEESFKPIRISELMTMQFKDGEWLVRDLIPSASIIAVSGAPASYKTWTILDLAIKIATGGILFDKFPTTQTGVLLIDEESGERLLQSRLKKLSKSFDLQIYTISIKGYKLTEDSIKNIVSFCKNNNVGLVIFDSLVRIHNEVENDAMGMAKVFNSLKKFNKEGLTVIFTHHNRKQGPFRSNPSQDMRGSSDISAAVDCHLAIDRRPKENLIIINQAKLRQREELAPFKVNIISDENELRLEFAGDLDEIQNKKSDIQDAVRDILEQTESPMYKQELFDALHKSGVEGGYSTFKKAINEMVGKGELFEARGEKNKVFCSLNPIDKEGIKQNNG